MGEKGFADINFSMEMWNKNHKLDALVASVGQSSCNI